MAEDWQPFVIERPGRKGRIKLGPEAKFWAQQHGMSLQEMAKYLLARDEGAEPSGKSENEDFLPNVTPSENIEDRREEP